MTEQGLETKISKYIKSNSIWILCESKQEKEKAYENMCMLEKAVLYAAEYTETIKKVLPAFTDHGFQHSRNVLDIMEKLLEQMNLIKIENGVRSTELSSYELAMLILAAFFHDIGMCKLEGKNVEDEPAYGIYAENKQYMDKEVLERKYIRDNHHIRVDIFYDDFDEKYKEFYWIEDGGNKKRFGDLVKICKSHNEGKQELDKMESYAGVDEKFLAIILRLADILDLDNTRAPLNEMEKIKFDEIEDGLYSLGEWKKHIDAEGIKILENNIISLTGETKSAKVYFLLERMITLIEQELRLCREVLLTTSNRFRECILPQVVKNNIKTKNFEAERCAYEIQKNQVIQLFMGEDLYLDKLVFIRELLQNSIDASICYGKIEERKMKKRNTYISSENIYVKPIQIKVWKEDGNYSFLIMDSGIGMDRNAIKEYFLKIGNSFFKSDDFKKTGVDFTPISRFGIGFLSTYLVTDDVKIITKHYDKKDVLLMLEINKTEELYTLREDDKNNNKFDASNYVASLGKEEIIWAKKELDVQENGTIIYFQMKEDIFNDVETQIVDALKKFLFMPPVEVNCDICGKEIIFTNSMNKEMAKKKRFCLDKKEICNVMRLKEESFKVSDAIIFESLPLDLNMWGDDGMVNGKLQLFTVYDTTDENNSYVFSYNLDYEKNSITVMLGGYIEEFEEMDLKECYKEFGLQKNIKVYFNGISHLANVQSTREQAYFNGFIQLEGNFRPSVDVARNGLGSLDLKTIGCLNYLYYKEMQKHVADDKNMRYAYFSLTLPPIMSELDKHIYPEQAFIQAKIFDYDWKDIAFIKTEYGYMSIDEIKKYLKTHEEIELYEEIKLTNNNFKPLLIRSLLNKYFKLVMQIKNNLVRVLIRQKDEWTAIPEEFPPLFFMHYENFEVLKYENYPLNCEHWFSRWLLEKIKEEELKSKGQILVKMFNGNLSNNRKKRNELVEKINNILEKYYDKKIPEQDIIVYISELQDIRDWLRVK